MIGDLSGLNQYFLSDDINFEAFEVRSNNHVPFCVFVDSYVATAVSNVSAAPRYPLRRKDKDFFM